ncbi:M28 family peptidase [Paenibacillus lignilyticus]|uniref:M28 family peptidase n=1 Tax=Paenibacillus lignilyticus TaxID=1172615 RepID=A0ABS5CKS0_9BACL|nr:M28 family peptidase [Paenibacillus lignilyticus]MBP3966465.1 M28 family peptidase [Paenibacillus lignilyticus]
MNKRIAMVIMLIVVIAGLWIGFLQMRPPSPPSESGADYPAFQRMLANLTAMTVAPHPSGSKELEAVRAHLLGQIRDMGLEPTVDEEVYTAADLEAEHLAQDGPPREVRIEKEKSSSGDKKPAPGSKTVEVIHREGPPLKDLALSNIWVKLDAPDTDRGVLMLAHYDSEDKALGAADDMVSVSSLLEVMREQGSRPELLKNDLYFLFTDGEEESALGAKAFVKSHPELTSKIDLAINFDARGDRGGLLMFETSAPNHGLLRHFQAASSHPIAFSFTTGLYRKMPNGTDLTFFMDAGYSGLNFAVAEGVEHYHRMTDNVENLDRGTAYNFLQTAMEMAEYAAGHEQIGGAGSSTRDSVFFTFLPGHLVVMTDIVAYFIAASAVFASLFWLLMQLRQGRVQLRQILIGTGWFAGMIGGMGLLSWGLVLFATQMMGLSKRTNNDDVFLCLFVVLSLIIFAVMYFRMRSQSLAEALAGLLPIQLLLTIGTVLLFVELSYVFALSTLGMLIVALMDRHRIGRMVASSVLGFGILVLYVPVGWLIFVMFMMPITPLVIALSVLPFSILNAFFATTYKPDYKAAVELK